MANFFDAARKVLSHRWLREVGERGNVFSGEIINVAVHDTLSRGLGQCFNSFMSVRERDGSVEVPCAIFVGTSFRRVWSSKVSGNFAPALPIVVDENTARDGVNPRTKRGARVIILGPRLVCLKERVAREVFRQRFVPRAVDKMSIYFVAVLAIIRSKHIVAVIVRPKASL